MVEQGAPDARGALEGGPDRPVWLRRVDGHAGLANQKAMEVAGVTKDTPNPAGGEIIRDGEGKPTACSWTTRCR
jgi:predicted amidohydrolase YtcJ